MDLNQAYFDHQLSLIRAEEADITSPEEDIDRDETWWKVNTGALRLDPTSEHAAGARFLMAMLDSGASGRAAAARMLDTAGVFD